MRKRLFILCSLLGGILTSCSYNSVEDLAAAVDCSADSVSFSTTIAPILVRYCTDSTFGNCHQADSENGDFTLYDGIQSYVEFGAVNKWVVVNKWMPPKFSLGEKALSDCQIDSIDTWIKAGGLDN